MLAEVADKPSGTNGFAFISRKILELRHPGLRRPIAQGFPDA
jgi:hypothetical protein